MKSSLLPFLDNGLGPVNKSRVPSHFFVSIWTNSHAMAPDRRS